MKITLHRPPDGYEAEAEWRPIKAGDHRLQDDGSVYLSKGTGIENRIILTPKRQRAEVRWYWATIKATRKRVMVVRWECNDGVFSFGGTPYTENYFTDITPIDPEYLDAPPVPEKDWWYGREKKPDRPFHVWCDQQKEWCRFSIVEPHRIWRYQPPAPSVETTDAGESEASNG